MVARNEVAAYGYITFFLALVLVFLWEQSFTFLSLMSLPFSKSVLTLIKTVEIAPRADIIKVTILFLCIQHQQLVEMKERSLTRKIYPVFSAYYRPKFSSSVSIPLLFWKIWVVMSQTSRFVSGFFLRGNCWIRLSKSWDHFFPQISPLRAWIWYLLQYSPVRRDLIVKCYGCFRSLNFPTTWRKPIYRFHIHVLNTALLHVNLVSSREGLEFQYCIKVDSLRC